MQHDARSVGLNTTATVVHSIVAVILIDAAFAVAYPESFVAQQPVASHDAAGTTEAMGRAVNRMIDELTLWLVQVVSAQGR